MPLFVPHKVLIEIMWYGGMSISEIDTALVEHKYNSMPREVYEEIIDGVNRASWEKAHAINEAIYAKNRNRLVLANTQPVYGRAEDFSKYYNPDALYDIMSYMVGARMDVRGVGGTKALQILTNDNLRKFVEIGLVVGIPLQSMRQDLLTLEPKHGRWSMKAILTYVRTFWNAGRTALEQSGIRTCDIRAYLTMEENNPHYDAHIAYLNAGQLDVLKHFGLADYSAIQLANKSLHGKIGSKIMDYFDNKTRKIIPSDYVKLYVHLDAQIAEQESADKGVEAYRNEIKRIFDRIDYVKDEYKSMDELFQQHIGIDNQVEVDEPYIKDER